MISPNGRWLGAGGAVFPVGEGRGADQLANENWVGDWSGWMGRDRKPPTGERLSHLRAVAALELMGTTEARKVLAVLARGLTDAVLTREAKTALERTGR
ncbi:MAG TPA: hypothetical protein VG097_08230 [Gemmata sp.]|nr:hypothetical protein [Gemmata sp.]